MPDKNDLVIIELDRPRVLRFGHKALKKMTALLGITMDKFEMSELDFADVEKVMYCGLLSDAKENGETLKLEDMEDLLDLAPDYYTIMDKMMAAFNASFGNGEIDPNSQGIAENQTPNQ